MSFIDTMRTQGHAVESVCRVLSEQGCQIAARTYRAWCIRPPAARTVSDAVVIDKILTLTQTADGQPEPEALYGRRKTAALLARHGMPVPRCTVDRAMRTLGRNGVRRGKAPRTTIPAKDGHRAGDLLDRDFTADAPNKKWVTDFTYVRTWSGFVYVAFIVDCFAQRIVGWNAGTTKATDLVMTPLRIALWTREREGRPTLPGETIHHSDAGTQGGFKRSSQHLSCGGVRWDDQRAGPRRRPGARRCDPRDGHRSAVRSSASSGSRSLPG